MGTSENLKKLYFILIVATLLSLSCNLSNLLLSNSDREDRSKLVLGELVPLLEGSLGPDGGELKVDLPDDPLDGVTILAASGVLPEITNITISQQEVKDHSYGRYFTPVTPLIHIDLGEASPQGYLTIQLPIDVPEGYFALAFHINPENGTLEGLPLVDLTDHSITFLSKRFSDFIVSIIKETALYGDIQTDFEVGRDNFRFPNQGSMISPKGHCAGQTLANLYFHNNLKDTSLYDAYDGYNTGFFETPNFWEDDVLAYKLSSLIQQRIWLQGNPDAIFWTNIEQKQPRLTYLTVAFLMLLTEEPQLIIPSDEASGSGHAIIAYGKRGYTFLVSDPNFPADDSRTLTFDMDNGVFQPYISGLKSDSGPVSFNRIFYIPPEDLVDPQFVDEQWADLKTGAFSFDPFPGIQVYISDTDPAGKDLPLFWWTRITKPEMMRSRFM